MKETLAGFSEHYFMALQDYLAGIGEGALGRGYELGRKSVSEGLGVLAFTAIYKEALKKTLSKEFQPAEMNQVLRSMEFFEESLSSYEISYRAFRESNAGLRRLNQMLENETRRITHAIHDEAGQLLASTHMALLEAERQLPLLFQGYFLKIKTLLRQSEDQLRHLVHEVRPTILDDLGLLPAIDFLADGISKRSELAIKVEGSIRRRLPSGVEMILYRIVREALTNVVKHAQASRVDIRIEQETQELRCSIHDDGIGFNEADHSDPLEEKGMGLISIHEQLKAYGGTLAIRSSAGCGTELLIFIPLEIADEIQHSPC